MEMSTITKPTVQQIETGRKQVNDETLIRLVGVYGDDSQGYQAAFEEWFIPAGGNKPEFYEVLFDTTIYQTAAEALADALPSAVKETAAWIGATVQPVEQPEPEPAKLDPAEYEITNGYVGMFGKTYETATAETLADAVEKAVERAGKTTDEIEQLLLAGKSVAWCNSPNYDRDHSRGIIRRKRAASPVQLVDCDCGHSVPRPWVMSASRGTSCPDCYDRMSN